jgi:transcriptional regulator with XRE-family HTH domain
MPRKTRTHVLAPDSPPERSLVPKHLTKQEFGKRLYRLMLGKGWNQSELARRADLPRDSISVYIRGRSLPTASSLRKLADALGVAPEELLPNHIEGAIDDDNPSFELKVSPNAPMVAWLRINRLVSTPVALKVAELVNADDPTKLIADGKRGR